MGIGLDPSDLPAQGARTASAAGRSAHPSSWSDPGHSIGVSLHTVGERATVLLGWALYLAGERCAAEERR